MFEVKLSGEHLQVNPTIAYFPLFTMCLHSSSGIHAQSIWGKFNTLLGIHIALLVVI